MQVKSIKRKGKYLQTSKKAFYKIFWHCEEKNCTKFVIPNPLRIKFFDNRNTTGSPYETFSTVRKKLIFFVRPHVWFIQIFAQDRWAAPTLSCSQLDINNTLLDNCTITMNIATINDLQVHNAVRDGLFEGCL